MSPTAPAAPSADPDSAARQSIRDGRTSLGIELGSTRIKACLIGPDPAAVLAVGAHEWENDFVDRLWTYPLEKVWIGIQDAYAKLAASVQERYGLEITALGALGVSGMMHGYLPFDEADQLLVPFRTWRNTNTGPAAAELSELFGVNIPLRWSVAHLYQAILDQEPHVEQTRFVTTLAGYVHWQLSDQRVLGVGDASGMFPIDSTTVDYDARMTEQFDDLVRDSAAHLRIRNLLPQVLGAGTPAGTLTAHGAALLDPSGSLESGAPLCPPEGDAGTGMVATGSVAPRTGNVSAGTSIFAMVVLQQPLVGVHPELDLVTTPAGDPVAMVHCNNGASEFGAWAGMFARFAEAAGTPMSSDKVFGTLLQEALNGEADAGGLVAYNYLAGEPITGIPQGRPMFLRTPESRLTLGNFVRSQLYGIFGTLSLGMRVLEKEGVAIDHMLAHGGLFRTAGIPQRMLADSLGTPVAVGETAAEGGAWGIAVLASYLEVAPNMDLASFLDQKVFAKAPFTIIGPEPTDVAAYQVFLERYRDGLAVMATAAEVL
ncbi:ATPase [Brachybacterium sp. JHP9]|uniref:ATPase n=1 Tax=Brachybacterium equifaecis TaxID=2910770 RepID=A0ABT0R4G3_9MICO|nr:FGGY-family carbohydrate kinase [Brachybacterium equifaecis]MCL6424159.1 ATPase [Brachybacterium equifaecis]